LIQLGGRRAAVKMKNAPESTKHRGRITARVVNSGKSQVVLFPKQFRIRSNEVEIFRRGDEIILRENMRGLERAFYLIAEMNFADALKNRNKDKPQKRKGL
jgi:antitoxin VapB